ncbi:ParB N-terminal domain-containing protein [Microbacterium sp. YY-01]|uniref:ParB N-terminal domain-containing protein n=1 Tax=Microbacterium sp. YY-01 TaxID=3421634 RepID=UPI003D187379
MATEEKNENVVVIRTIDSIHVGARHRKDLGDIDALAESIDNEGVLQPITVTPDGVLVCGARRLAAYKQLGWSEARVWVRSGISTDLEFMLAEQDDNAFHKPLTAVEAATLYREMKELLAADAAQRKASTQLSPENQPRWNGPAESAGPLKEPLGDARRQAAEMVTGTSSYTRLEEINFIQRTAEDQAQPEEIREVAGRFLDEIHDDAPTHPRWQQVKQLVASAEAERDLMLHQLAEAKLSEVRSGKKPKKRSAGGPVAIAPMTPRAFVLTWSELHTLYASTDPAEIAVKITRPEADTFFTAIGEWNDFADRLRAALRDDSAAPTPRQLRAI